MVNKKIQKIKINNTKFKIQSSAKKVYENYITSLKKHLSENGDKEDIWQDMKDRIEEHLKYALNSNKQEVLTTEDIQTLINKMGTIEDMKQEAPDDISKKNERKSPKGKLKKLLRLSAYIFFWIPHIFWALYILGGAFLFFTVILRGPEELTIASALTYIGALLIPTIGIVVGVYLNIRKKLRSMLLFLLGIEVPLFLLSVFRIFVIQIYSPVLGFMFILILYSCFILFLDLIDLKIVKRYKHIFEYLKLVAYSIGSLMSGYIFLIWAFFFPYIALSVLKGFLELLAEMFSFNPYNNNFAGGGILAVSPLMFLIFGIMSFLYLSPAYVFPIYLKKFINLFKRHLNSLFNFSKGFKIKKNAVSLTNVSKLLVPFIAVFSSVLIITVMSYDFNSKYREEITKVTNSQGEFDVLKEKYMDLYVNENRTKDALKEKFFARYENIFDDESDKIFYKLYCQQNKYRYYSSPFSDDFEFNLPSVYCDEMYTSFSFLVSAVVYKGNLFEDFESADIEYKKVFDDNIQRAESDMINKYTSNTLTEGVFSFRGTIDDSAGLIDEDKKSVFLEDLHVKSTINTDYNLHETNYTFTFKNKEITNQEVYFEFSLPEETIITDLNLGPDLENPGIVAPKAAAKTVYERSLTRSIDPALMELVGPRTYRLRVYPIPPKGGDIQSNWNSRTNTWEDIIVPDYQKVQFTVSGQIKGKYQLLRFPYTRNLDISNKTNYSAEISFEGENKNKIKEISATSTQYPTSHKEEPVYSEFYKLSPGRNGDELKDNSVLSFSKFSNICDYIQKDESNFGEVENIRIFYDFSKSAESIQNRKIYQEVTNKIFQEFDTSNFEIYEYNFDVNYEEGIIIEDQIYTWIMNNEFWGYSDTSDVAEKLIVEDTQFENTVTYIITDSSDFEFSEEVDFDFNYSTNLNNQINIIQVGDRLTSQKEEVNNLVWSSNGRIFHIKDIEEVDIIELDYKNENCQDQQVEEETVWNDVIEKLNKSNDSKDFIGYMNDSQSRLYYAKEMTKIAKEEHFVDPFNSMIAVQTTWQKQQLDELSEDDDAYDEEYDIGEQNLNVPSMFKGQSMPESETHVILLTIIIFSLIAFVFPKIKILPDKAVKDL
ncbi:hypothetical protein GF362_00570 [Candidatus Dojkabacteria bacterium]|nr:hypothetical protein [Candidatus Dojkabacteria bacterium]